jgi:hypothetical protein
MFLVRSSARQAPWAGSLKDDWSLLKGLKLVFVKWDMAHMGQATDQWRHFNERPISELHGEVDSIQTSLKLLFILQQYWNVVSVFQPKADSSHVCMVFQWGVTPKCIHIPWYVNRFIFSRIRKFSSSHESEPYYTVGQILLMRKIWLNSLIYVFIFSEIFKISKNCPPSLVQNVLLFLHWLFFSKMFIRV